MSEIGKKYDNGKRQWHLLRKSCVKALESVLDVLGFGAAKYGEENWKKVDDAAVRYRDALDRHLAELDKGDTYDTETGLPHLAHVATNALFLLQLQLESGVRPSDGVPRLRAMTARVGSVEGLDL